MKRNTKYFFLSSAVITLLYENERPTQFCIVNYEARVRISSRPNFFKTSFLQLLNCNSPARIIFFFFTFCFALSILTFLPPTFSPQRHKILLEMKPMYGSRLCTFGQCMRISSSKGERKDV